MQLTRQGSPTKIQAVKIASARLEECSQQSMVIWEQSFTRKKEL